eukprot:c915_g1_i1 orf=464-2509(-)
MGLVMLLQVASQVPASEYALLLCGLLAFFIYYALELHIFEDLFTAFRGHPVQLLYNASSSLASQVLPHCHLLHRRYWPTPWLCSPHLQTAFLHFFGRSPQFEYHRQLCRTPDGGTIALDWLFPRDCSKTDNVVSSIELGKFNETRIVVVIPGLTSDSADAYVKHIAYSLAASGWRVVVANHRGLGGVSITSNQFYNAGWTEDLRRIVNHLHQVYPNAPLLAVGTSIGANILVKYLGEEGEKTPLGGAAAICCPWDLVVCDRFISRKLIQKFYDIILAFGLRSYAAVHQAVLSQMADWDLISKARSVRDFDNHCTCIVGQYETVDTYYRKNSSAYYLPSVSIPLFCISALDDPVCTKEAIPRDECRVNANVVLGLTRHGGHLAFFEGLTASSIWWVRATTEFLENLCASPLLHMQKQGPVSSCGISPLLENVVDVSPYLSIPQNGVVAAETMPNEAVENVGEQLPEDYQEGLQVDVKASTKHCGDSPSFHFRTQEEGNAEKTSGFTSATAAKADSQASSSALSENVTEPTLKVSLQDYSHLLTLESTLSQLLEQVQAFKQIGQKVSNESSLSIPMHNEVNKASSEEWTSSHTHVPAEMQGSLHLRKGTLASLYRSGSSFGHNNKKPEAPSLKGIKVVAKQNQRSLWLLAYIAIVTTWPLLGSALFIHGKKRLKDVVMKFVSK